MKRIIPYLLLTLLLATAAGCADTDFLPDAEDNGGTAAADSAQCVLWLSIDNGDFSRVGDHIDLPGLKSHWCYGDEVKVSMNGMTFTFKLTVPTGKEEGDICEDEYAPFICSEGIAISGNVSGTITYTPKKSYPTGLYDDATGKIKNGYIRYLGNSYKAKAQIIVEPWQFQVANNSASHLESRLSAEFVNIDLRSASTDHPVNYIPLKRDFCVVKIVLDDIYYNVCGGSLLLVDGISPNTACLVLGENKFSKLGSEGMANLPTTEQLFYIPPSEGRPFTGYARRAENEDEKLVAYLVLKEECTASGPITVRLRDLWSLDWYE